MDHSPAREKLLQIISENPGIHFREIQRISGMAVGQTEYHLYQLEKSEQVVIRVDGKNRRYFIPDQGSIQERKIVLYLRNSKSASVIHELIRYDRVELNRLVKGRKTKQEKIANAIKSMENDGIISRKIEDGYVKIFLVSRDSIIKILKKYRKGFIDTLEENLLSLLDES